MNTLCRVAVSLALFCGSSAWANDQDKISTREVGENRFEITIKSTTVFDVAGATRRIAPTAAALCTDKRADLGRYTFEKNEALSGAAKDDSFTMIQSVHCVDSAPESLDKVRRPQLKDESAVDAVRLQLRELSQEYFEKLYADLGSDASVALKSDGTLQGGEPGVRAPTVSGTQVEINLYRVTVYDNPPDAPSGGIYVAVDYDNQVGNVAHHCGYLMWHSPDGAEFKLGRIESGTLDDALLAKMSPKDNFATRKALRCSNFYDK